jgi:hypothetical protein
MTANNHDRILVRIVRIAAVLGIVGTIVVWVRLGIGIAAGFLVGAVLSILNFHGLKRVVEGLSETKQAGMRGTPMFWAFRYFLLAAIGYVIVKYLGISLMPILAGLFVAAAAIIVEILYEITYART